MDQKTEAEIVVRVLKGDRQAYTLLIEEYKNPIYNLAYRMTHNPQDAEDLAQETFLRSFSALSRFDVNRNFIPGSTLSAEYHPHHLKNAERKAVFRK
jgi:RNA polymerase sigma-70 factor (ECF subfamily)